MAISPMAIDGLSIYDLSTIGYFEGRVDSYLSEEYDSNDDVASFTIYSERKVSPKIKKHIIKRYIDNGWTEAEIEEIEQSVFKITLSKPIKPVWFIKGVSKDHYLDGVESLHLSSGG
jgi:hypothetical protein